MNSPRTIKGDIADGEWLWGSIDDIKVIDDFLNVETYTKLVSYIDDTYQTKTGKSKSETHWIPGHTSVGPLGASSWFWYMDVHEVDLFKNELAAEVNFKLNTTHKSNRIYFNGMCHGQEGQLHFDDIVEEAYTLLIYVLPTYDYHWGGQTVFVDKNNRDFSVCPKPNRAVYFPSRLIHKAQSFSSSTAPMRVSLAMKLTKV